MSLIYIDTNIYLDYFEGRNDYLRPLGEFAFQTFQRTLSCEFTIIFSGLVLKELSNYMNEEDLYSLLNELKEKNKLIETKTTFQDKEKARQMIKQKRTDFNDTLHAIIAQRMNAKYLVTRNVKDYLELQEIVKIMMPESL